MLTCQEGHSQSLRRYYSKLTNQEGRFPHPIDLTFQLAVLTTNLPVAWDSSIFLRVDESRVDVIKALIIGPEGTP